MDSQQSVEQALLMLAEGETLSDIAKALCVNRTTLLARLNSTPELIDKYARAREAGIDVRAEELENIASEAVPMLPSGGLDSAAVAQLRLRVDTRKWMLSKLAAHKYGDKLEIKQDTTITDLTEEQLDARLAQLLEQSGKIAAIRASSGEEPPQG